MQEKEEKTFTMEIPVKRYDHFYCYRVGSFYIIELSTMYRASDRVKTYKSYKTVTKAWNDILSGKTDYTNF